MSPSFAPAVFVHDMKIIVRANPAACALFRCEEWEVIDRRLLDFVPAELVDLTRIQLYATRHGRGSIASQREYRFVRCDGSTFSAVVTTQKLDEDMYETTVIYLGEHGD